MRYSFMVNDNVRRLTVGQSYADVLWRCHNHASTAEELTTVEASLEEVGVSETASAN